MQQLWRIELFGGLRVRSANDSGREITRFGRQRAGAMLAYLAYNLHRAHPRELLIELLWPESETGARQNGFRVALTSLRRQLEPPGIVPGSVLITDRVTVRLNPAAVTTDVGDFEALTKAASVSQHELEKIRLLTDALALYQGPLLVGSFDEWVLAEQPRIDSLVVQALRDLVKSLTEVGDIPRAIEHIQRALTFDPECEEGISELMKLYVLDGQPASALRHFHDFERNLWKKYAARPNVATQELARLIEQQAKTAGAAAEHTTSLSPATSGAAVNARGAHKRHGRAAAPGTSPTAATATAPGMEAEVSAPAVPSGTVTFLLFDVSLDVGAGETTNESDRAARARKYQEIICREVNTLHGYAVRATSDSFLFAFARAGEALDCAIACVANSAEFCVTAKTTAPAHSTAPANGIAPANGTAPAQAPCLRAALFTRDAEFRQGGYHDCSYDDLERILLAAHRGQIVCAADTAALLRTHNHTHYQLANLGFFRLSGLEEPVNLFQVNSEQIPVREFPPLNLPAVHSGNLPLQYNNFFGRETELSQLGAMLESKQYRLITLTGMGGSGKTRLALELARRLTRAWRGEVWFVSLSDLSDPQLIVNAIRDALRLPPLPHTSPLDQVVDLLSRQPSLLLLDNFEHMVEDGSAFVESLLNRVPTLTLLLTSQHRLHVADEEEFRVDALPTPQGGTAPAELVRNPSVQLFVDRAQVVRADFQVTDSNAHDVASLCRHLDGIPLAIELAAARATTLTPAQMMVRLAEHGLDSFVNPIRNAAQRQRTLRAALEWSHQLLPLPVQHFFNQLAVFRGGCTLEAAERVPVITQDDTRATGASGRSTQWHVSASLHAFEYLEHLTDASLILVEDDTPHVRYRMLETIHRYAQWQLEQNEDVDALRRRHALYYLQMAEEAELQLQGPAQGEWFSLLYREQENLRVALDWALGAVSQATYPSDPYNILQTPSPAVMDKTAPATPQQPRDIEVALRLVNALGLFWELHGQATEGRTMVNRVLEYCRDAPEELRATALYYGGRLALFQTEFAVAHKLLQESLELHRRVGNRRGMALAMGSLGSAMINQNDLAEAKVIEEQTLEILREFGDKRNIVTALNALSAIALNNNDCDTARARLEEGLDLLRELGDRRGEALSLNSLGAVAMTQNDFERARTLMEEGLVIMRELGDKWGIAIALNSLGFVTMNQGDLDTARTLLQESLPIFRELGVKARLAEALSELGEIARSQGDYDEAADFYSKSLALYEDMEFHSGIAWDLRNLGWVACRRGEVDLASDFFSRSLSLYLSLDNRLGIVHSLAGLAAASAMAGENQKAAQLLGASEALRATITIPLFICERSDHEFTLNTLQSSGNEQQLEAAWLEGRSMTVEEVISFARNHQDS